MTPLRSEPIGLRRSVGENSNQILDEMAQFLTGKWRPIETETVLATVLFTDIVNSTKLAAELGDRGKHPLKGVPGEWRIFHVEHQR